MSTPLVVTLNALNVLTGGKPSLMAKHRISESPAEAPRSDSDRYHSVPAAKCPHGHYARYAAKHCKKGCKK